MRLAALRPIGRLDRYVGLLFLASYATALLLIVGLVVILDLAAHLNWFEPWKDGSRVPTSVVVGYYLLSIPFLFLQVAPFITVVAGLFAVSRLQKNNELVAALAAGVSVRRALLPIFMGGILAAAGMFALRELATPVIGPQREALYDVLEHHRFERVYEDLWSRADEGAVVHMGELRPHLGSPPRAEVRDLKTFQVENGIRIEQIAERATWAERDGQVGWILDGGLRREDGEESTRRAITWIQDPGFTPHTALLAHKARMQPLELSFAEILRLAGRDPDNVQYQTLLQYHLTFPLANLVLLMVALPFLVGCERGKAVEGLALGCLACVLYFAVDFVARTLGLEGDLSPLLAGWLPILLFGSLGVVLHESMRT